MKKVVLALLFLLLGILIYPSYKLILLEKENNQIKAVINSYQKDSEIIKKNSLEHEAEIKKIKEEKKEKWEALESWQKIKKQIEKAINS